MPEYALPVDGYYDQPEAQDFTLPVAADPREAAIGIRPVVEARPEPIVEVQRPEPILHQSGKQLIEVDHNPWFDTEFSKGTKVGNRLFGTGGEERYQTWPEKVLREGVSAAGDVMETNPTAQLGLRREDFTDIPPPSMPTKDSTWLGEKLGVAPVTAQPNDYMIDAAQAMSALAGSGGIAGADATLGAGPFLRPALKYEGKIYKAPLNGQHLDALPAHLQDTFQRQAMSGEDISNFNFGFMNHKGQFLSREAALDYAIKEGLVDPHAGQYGALTSTLLADSSKPGTAIEAMAKTNKPAFYSALEHNVSQITQSKMTGDQWLGTLANKPGVKPEELQWTGLQDFLAENKGKPVSKEQIQEHLAGNKVELKDVDKGASEYHKLQYKPTLENNLRMFDSILPEFKTVADVASAKQHNAQFRETVKGKSDQEIFNAIQVAKVSKDYPSNLFKSYDTRAEAEAARKAAGADQHLDVITEQRNSDTKYHGYQLPGGENYREKLLTLPSKTSELHAARAKNDDRIQELRDQMRGTSGSDAIRSEIRKLQDENQAFNEKIKSEPPYKSSHWDEPNIIAHVRMNDRNIEGKKSLHLEEIQSDWHQQGRDKGYADSQKPYEVFDPVTAEIKARYATEAEAKEAVRGSNSLDYSKSNGVPDAPFKKTWHELALKRMIREAAEKGYDRLSWTPGEAQAARYSLEKTLNKVSYNPKQKYLKAWDKNGNEVMAKEGVSPEQLSDYVGKEGAQKLLDQKPKDFDRLPSVKKEDLKVTQDEHQYIVTNKDKRGVKVGKGTVGSEAEALDYAERYLNRTAFEVNNNREIEYGRLGPTHVLEGQDLKVGGEGMKGFYDQIIPKALEKIGKEHGVKVKTVYKHEGNPTEAHRKFIDDMTNELHDDLLKSAKAEGMNEDKAKRFADRHTANLEPWQLSKALNKNAELDRVYKEKLDFEQHGKQPIHYIDLPQSLKDHALHKGFPLFSSPYPGVMFLPVDKDPFNDK